MSEVTVTAVQPVLGLREGDTVTVERTPRIDKHIDSGHLRVLHEKPAPAPADDATPDTADAPVETKTPRGKSAAPKA